MGNHGRPPLRFQPHQGHATQSPTLSTITVLYGLEYDRLRTIRFSVMHAFSFSRKCVVNVFNSDHQIATKQAPSATRTHKTRGPQPKSQPSRRENQTSPHMPKCASTAATRTCDKSTTGLPSSSRNGSRIHHLSTPSRRGTITSALASRS